MRIGVRFGRCSGALFRPIFLFVASARAVFLAAGISHRCSAALPLIVGSPHPLKRFRPSRFMPYNPLPYALRQDFFCEHGEIVHPHLADST
jgi:hypothetical protein